MSELKLDPMTLEDYLPHRGINLFLDEVTVDVAAKSAASRTVVPADDPRDRGIFARRGPDPGAYWYTPFLGELLALTGVTLLKGNLTGDQVAVFSSITDLRAPGLARMDDEVVGKARIERQRGPFTQFAAEVTAGGREVLVGEILAGVSTLAEIAGQATVPLSDADGEAVDPEVFAFKRPELRFVDRVQEADVGAGRLRAVYTYPADHPFTVGHFPGAPIMMGMTQWAAAADAGYLAMLRGGLERAVVQARLRRPNGDPVFSARDLVLEVDAAGPRTVAAKRLAFRGVVTPGDGLVVEVDVAAC